MVNASQNYAKDVSELDVTGQITFQGKEYGIIACFYINTNYDDISMANNKIIDDSNQCDIDITIEKDDSEFVTTCTTNVHNVIKPDLKMPTHHLTHVLHLLSSK